MVSGICCFNIESKVQVGSTTLSFFSQTDDIVSDKVLKMSACIPVATGIGFGLDVAFW